MMEWEEHLRDMAQTAVEHPEYKMLEWFIAKAVVPEIDRLRAEVDRLGADRQLEADIDLPPGVITLMRENEGLKAALAEKDAEIEKVTHDRDLWENIAAMRLADQEAIERHTRRVVAKECAEIAEAMWSDHYWAWPAMQTYADKIRKKYGVE